jgi:Inositol hexakisphosphate
MPSGRNRVRMGRWLFAALFVVVVASPAAAGSGEATLIINAPDKAGTPGNYRSTSDVSKLGDDVVVDGLEKLRASGSAQFSAEGLAAVLQRTGGRPLTVLDLRQESHGFVGGAAVSWYVSRDTANAGKTDEQINADESELLAGLAGQRTVTVKQVKKDENTDITSAKTVELPAPTVETEQAVAEAQNAAYVRVHAADHFRFTDAEIDTLVRIWQGRPADSWLHVHCTAGDGRTTQALVIFDLLENATTVSLKDVGERQHELGQTDVLRVRAKPEWRHDRDADRVQLLRRFSRYAKEHPGGEGETWSSWSARNPS